ncbi:hypothetical protein RUND412_000012 [Rhizina undulata]
MKQQKLIKSQRKSLANEELLRNFSESLYELSSPDDTVNVHYAILRIYEYFAQTKATMQGGWASLDILNEVASLKKSLKLAKQFHSISRPQIRNPTHTIGPSHRLTWNPVSTTQSSLDPEILAQAAKAPFIKFLHSTINGPSWQ